MLTVPPHRRDFDEEVLNAGKNIASQQMGYNKGASQAGMSPYGTKRREVNAYATLAPAAAGESK